MYHRRDWTAAEGEEKVGKTCQPKPQKELSVCRLIADDKLVPLVHVKFQKQVISARDHLISLFAGRIYKTGHGITGKVITSILSPGHIKMIDVGHLKSSVKLCKNKFIIHFRSRHMKVLLK